MFFFKIAQKFIRKTTHYFLIKNFFFDELRKIFYENAFWIDKGKTKYLVDFLFFIKKLKT